MKRGGGKKKEKSVSSLLLSQGVEEVRGLYRGACHEHLVRYYCARSKSLGLERGRQRCCRCLSSGTVARSHIGCWTKSYSLQGESEGEVL